MPYFILQLNRMSTKYFQSDGIRDDQCNRDCQLIERSKDVMGSIISSRFSFQKENYSITTSTDEVYGTLGASGLFTRKNILRSTTAPTPLQKRVPITWFVPTTIRMESQS